MRARATLVRQQKLDMSEASDSLRHLYPKKKLSDTPKTQTPIITTVENTTTEYLPWLKRPELIKLRIVEPAPLTATDASLNTAPTTLTQVARQDGKPLVTQRIASFNNGHHDTL